MQDDILKNSPGFQTVELKSVTYDGTNQNGRKDLVFENFVQKLVSSAFALLFTEISVVWVTEISVVRLQKFL